MEVREKIRKLLSLAGNNPNEAEAISALTKARAIMAQHGLGEEEFKDSPAYKKNLKYARLIERPQRRLPKWQGSMAVAPSPAIPCGG